MMTVLVIVFLLKGSNDVRGYAIPFEPHVTVAECQEASGPALQQIPPDMDMLGWTCVSFPFTKANAA